MTLIHIADGPDGPRAIRLSITPSFDMSDPSHQPRHLSLVMTFRSLNLKQGDLLVTLPIIIGNVPSQNYGKGALEVSDDSGPLELAVSDVGNERVWTVQRATYGDIVFRFKALPRAVDSDTPPGPRVDLREQFGGLLGVGSSFLPLPRDPDMVMQYRFTVEWDLSQSPDKTRAVWSLGEGIGPIQRTGSLSVLRDSVYGVGPIRSYLDSSVDPSGAFFNVIWFGDPVFDVVRFGKDTQEMFVKMSRFFGETPSEDNSYRIFLRSAPRGIGGMAFQRSFIFEYDKDILRLENVMFPTLAHEMVHNWPLLGKETDGSNQELDMGDENWYSEGVATYYQMFLPYRFGLRDEEYLLGQLNSYLSGYYTNPLIRMTNKEATRRSWEEPNALRLRYNRGFTYLLKVGAQVREQSAGKTSIDTIVYELLGRKRTGKSYKLKDWLAIIQRELGQSGVDEYHDMANGLLVVPPTDFLSPEYKMKIVRQDQEVLEFGFNGDSINKRRIQGLKPGSRAEEAGLQEGDKILESSFSWEVGDDYEAKMNLTVQREDGASPRVLKISYWPRTYEKAECYQVVQTEN